MTDTTATIESHQHARAIFERLNGNYSSEVVLAALRLAYSSGAAAEAARHLRVISGTGDAGEQRELEALCRASKVHP